MSLPFIVAVFVPDNVAPGVVKLMTQFTVPASDTTDPVAAISLTTSHREEITGEEKGSPCFSNDGMDVTLNFRGRISTVGKSSSKEDTAFPWDEYETENVSLYPDPAVSNAKSLKSAYPPFIGTVAVPANMAPAGPAVIDTVICHGSTTEH